MTAEILELFKILDSCLIQFLKIPKSWFLSRPLKNHLALLWHKWGCMRSIRTTTKMYSSKFSVHRNQSEILNVFCAPPNHNRYLNWVLGLNQNPNCVLGHYQNLQLWCIPPKSWRCASKKISFRRKLMPLAFKTRTGRK